MPAPVISSISPSSARVGVATAFTITGTDLSSSVVSIEANDQSLTSNTGTSVVFTWTPVEVGPALVVLATAGGVTTTSILGTSATTPITDTIDPAGYAIGTSLNLLGKDVVKFTSGGAVSWSTNCGALFTDAGCTLSYTSGTRTTIYFKAQNRTSSGTVVGGATTSVINITGKFPSVPHYPSKFQLEKRGIVSNTKRDGSISGRILGSGDLIRDYSLTFRNRIVTEYQEVETFVSYHYPFLKFVYQDLLIGVSGVYQFAGPVKPLGEGPNRISFEVDIIQVPS